MSRRRDASHATPSEAVLREEAARTALDVAQVPINGRLHRRLVSCTRDFVAQDARMAATADALRRAAKHADTLHREANEWEQLEQQAPELRRMLDSILATLDPMHCREHVGVVPAKVTGKAEGNAPGIGGSSNSD